MATLSGVHETSMARNNAKNVALQVGTLRRYNSQHRCCVAAACVVAALQFVLLWRCSSCCCDAALHVAAALQFVLLRRYSSCCCSAAARVIVTLRCCSSWCCGATSCDTAALWRCNSQQRCNTQRCGVASLQLVLLRRCTGYCGTAAHVAASLHGLLWRCSSFTVLRHCGVVAL